MPLNRRLLTMVAGLILMMLIPTGLARGDAAMSQTDEVRAAESVSAFADRFFADHMASAHVPGAVFVLVKDGEVVLSRGYGYANLESGLRADPGTTSFRVASVTKSFTNVALMQLVEAGRIRLDGDVNSYLGAGVQVKNPFGRPLTVRDLLLHTDGLEERGSGIFARSAEEMPPLAEVIQAMPPLVLPPGEIISYGSYGAAVGSYVVEQVTGMGFGQYVAEHIFSPLGMRDSTLTQAPSPGVATIYQVKDGKPVPAPYLYLTTPATGGAAVTADDMGRFMLAMLQGGALEQGRVLQPETVRAMFTEQYKPHGGLPGVTYGFFAYASDKGRGIVRDGTGLGVTSRIFFMPDQQMGFFVACNTKADELVEELTSALVERYGRPIPSGATAIAPTGGKADRFAGTYRYVQYSRHTVAKVMPLFAGSLRVTANKDGTLTVAPPGMGDVYGGFESAGRWREESPGLFRSTDGVGYLAFREQDGGTYLFSGRGYHGAYERVPWHQSPVVQLALAGLFALAFFAGVGIWAAGRPLPAGFPLWGRHLLGALCLLNLLVLAAVPLAFMTGNVAGFPSIAFVAGPSLLLRALIAIPYATSVLTAGVVAAGLLGGGTWTGRGLFLLTGLLSAGYLGFLRYWNLFGLRL